jgi:shikimate kinase
MICQWIIRIGVLDSKIEPNIVITGFMGTGKSTVGPLVAEQLSRPFVDTDEEIVQRAAMSIPEMFERDGEAAFRKLEAEICVDLAARTGLVISTGGGALLNPDTLIAMTATGMVICLNASEAAIEDRLTGEEAGRPLANDWRARFEERRQGYAAIPYQLDTTGKSPDVVAAEVIDLWKNLFE